VTHFKIVFGGGRARQTEVSGEWGVESAMQLTSSATRLASWLLLFHAGAVATAALLAGVHGFGSRDALPPPPLRIVHRVHHRAGGGERGQGEREGGEGGRAVGGQTLPLGRKRVEEYRGTVVTVRWLPGGGKRTAAAAAASAIPGGPTLHRRDRRGWPCPGECKGPSAKKWCAPLQPAAMAAE